MIEFHERIRMVRVLIADLTQVDFAKDLGVSRGHISNIETGAAVPSDQLIKSICRTHGIEEEWLRDGIEPIRKGQEVLSKENQGIIQWYEEARSQIFIDRLASQIKILTMLSEELSNLRKVGGLKIKSNHFRITEFLSLKVEFENKLKEIEEELVSIIQPTDLIIDEASEKNE